MLFFLQLTLVAQIAYYWFEINLNDAYLKDKRFHYDHKYYCGSVVVVSLPAYMLAIATLLNANKWIYYNIRVRLIKSTD